MRVIKDIYETKEFFRNVVLTLGAFDGVHLGHRRIIEKVVQDALGMDGVPAVLTMEPHPREFFSPDHAPNLLTTTAKKLQLFEAAGIELVFLLDFNSKASEYNPTQFVEEIICGRCRAKELVVGHDFRFGKEARGDYNLLVELSSRYDYSAIQIPPLFILGERVSSTLIRECVLDGNLDEAALFLGRHYSITGNVISGHGIGYQLGFPTANIKPSHSAIPPQGVYIAGVTIDSERYAAAVNIGIAPTIRHEDMLVEAFILDFSRDILGRDIEITFYKRLRTEKRFPSHEELKRQIELDITSVREYHEGRLSSF